MLNGIYSAASAMEMAELKHEVIANNLANANTAGFKRDNLPVESFSMVLNQQLANEIPDGPSSYNARSVTDFRQGFVAVTAGKFDVAINGKGFFSVEDEQGNRFYTRDGSFGTNSEGVLVNNSGYPVMGGGGEITIPASVSGPIVIDSEGGIYAGETLLDQLNVSDFADRSQLAKIGGNLYRAPAGVEGEESEEYSIQQGALEKSNVNVVNEMVEMISNSRQYEAAQKMIQSQDSTLGKMIDQVGASV